MPELGPDLDQSLSNVTSFIRLSIIRLEHTHTAFSPRLVTPTSSYNLSSLQPCNLVDCRTTTESRTLEQKGRISLSRIRRPLDVLREYLCSATSTGQLLMMHISHPDSRPFSLTANQSPLTTLRNSKTFVNSPVSTSSRWLYVIPFSRQKWLVVIAIAEHLSLTSFFIPTLLQLLPSFTSTYLDFISFKPISPATIPL